MREPFIWEDVEHWTGGELVETVMLISDTEEAKSFMDAYIEACDDQEHAETNIAYICGMAGEDGREQLELFGIDPPSGVISPRQWWANSSLGVKSWAT